MKYFFRSSILSIKVIKFEKIKIMNCCICYESVENPLSCSHCVDGKYCDDCFNKIDSTSIKKCAICRSDLNYILRYNSSNNKFNSFKRRIIELEAANSNYMSEINELKVTVSQFQNQIERLISMIIENNEEIEFLNNRQNYLLRNTNEEINIENIDVRFNLNVSEAIDINNNNRYRNAMIRRINSHSEESRQQLKDYIDEIIHAHYPCLRYQFVNGIHTYKSSLGMIESSCDDIKHLLSSYKKVLRLTITKMRNDNRFSYIKIEC